MSTIENVLTAENKEAITSLLFQLADDDFLYSIVDPSGSDSLLTLRKTSLLLQLAKTVWGMQQCSTSF